MDLQLHSISNAELSGKLSITDAVFGCEYNEPLIHQVVTAYLAGARQGTKRQKSRSDARGGGAKPWRQKGMGRARAGTNRSPIWRGGGRAFAARPRDYSQKVNRKMYRAAMRSILSELARSQRLIVIDEISLDTPKTKALFELLQPFDLKTVLIVSEDISENLHLASRNLHWVGVIDDEAIDPALLIGFDKVIMTKGVIAKLEERLQ